MTVPMIHITSKSINGNGLIYAYNVSSHAHAVSSITYGTQRNFTYDNNGNMTYGWDFTNPTNPKSRDIDYNADNMPSQIVHSSGFTTNMLYDGMGTRVKKSVLDYNGRTTHTYYIGDHFEIRGGTTIKYIYAGNLRVAHLKGSTRSYFHKDHLGSSAVMTDNSGAEVESTEYMPFGSQRNHSGTDTSDYRFTDQELDTENGLYNYNARLYDPFIGRFISPDSIIPQPYNPQSLNRYSYCLNNPLIYTDPSGHQEEENEEEEEDKTPSQNQIPASLVDYYWFVYYIGSNEYCMSQIGVNLENALQEADERAIAQAMIKFDTILRALGSDDVDLRNDAIEAAMALWGIPIPETGIPTYEPLQTESLISEDGDITIGTDAFSRTPGWLGLSIAHEVEVHYFMQWKNDLFVNTNNWGQKKQITAMLEVQAYRWEREQITRFRLNWHEIFNIDVQERRYYNTTENRFRDAVDNKTYDYIPDHLLPEYY